MGGLSAVVIAIIGAVGGAVAAGVGGWLRSRRAVQSAARIHAELTDNSAAIRYYRKVGDWPTIGEVRHAAWDDQGLTLSRMRRATVFHSIQQGYSALEGIAFVVRADSQNGLPAGVVMDILNDSIGHVREALLEAGRVGGIEDDDLRAQIRAMDAQQPPTDGGAGASHVGTGVIPSSTLDAIARSGTAAQQASAKTTLEGMEVQVSIASRHQAVVANRIIRDAQHAASETDAGVVRDARVVRREGDPPTGGDAADELYEGLGASRDFFSSVFSRDSVDGHGALLEGVVHYGDKFSNMFWDGERVVAGDGDGELFNRFTIALELIAHEVAVGVIRADTKLSFSNQAGALIQAISNVLGSLIKQYTLSQTVEEADWLVGVGVLGPRVNGAALVSLAAPGTAYDDPVLGRDPQPSHMRDFIRTVSDNGGVHVNSGIPGHAFYITAMTLGGCAWGPAGRIWYEALRHPHLRATTGFRAFATITRSVATHLYGAASDEVAAVDVGWDNVGVKYTA